MCNLYSLTRAQDAMRHLFDGVALADKLGNLAPLPEIYPDQAAPIVRHGAEGYEMVMGRWGMPTPAPFLEGKKTDRGVTNIRNAGSPHWRQWAATSHRCLVPLSKFAEPGRGGNVWFGFPDDRPAFFAGLWTRWTSVRKLKDGETTDDLFAFLTTEPNAEVAAHHPKAMPVLLTDPADWTHWMTAPWREALALQKPYPDDELVLIE